jgi:HEAT repeat protein
MHHCIAKAIGSLGDRTVLPEMMQMLRNGQIDSYVRIGIIKAIGLLGDKTVLPEMMQMLRNEQIDFSTR